MNLGVKKWTSMSVGTGQLCHVRRLAFYFIISFYLMQHKPLWRSKFRILRIKKTRTKIGTLRILHTSLKLHRNIRSGSRSQRPTWGKQELLLTRFGHGVEHSSVAQKFQRLCFCFYLYFPELLSLNLYMTLLSFVMLLLNYVFSPIQQAHCILMSASASFMKKTFEN